MSWWRFHGICGPGHQSSWEEYVWLHAEYDDDKGKEELLEDMWQEMIPHWASFSHNSGSHEKIELPEEVRKLKILEMRESLKRARFMLEILGAEEEEPSP